MSSADEERSHSEFLTIFLVGDAAILLDKSMMICREHSTRLAEIAFWVFPTDQLSVKLPFQSVTSDTKALPEAAAHRPNELSVMVAQTLLLYRLC